MTLEMKVDIIGWHTLVEISSARIAEWEQLFRVLEIYFVDTGKCLSFECLMTVMLQVKQC